MHFKIKTNKQNNFYKFPFKDVLFLDAHSPFGIIIQTNEKFRGIFSENDQKG